MKKNISQIIILTSVIASVSFFLYRNANSLDRNSSSGRLKKFHENVNFYKFDLPIDPTINCTTTKTKPEFIICLHHPSIDIYISAFLLDKGIWEHEITKIFTKLMTTNPNAIFLDIGANIGYYTLLAAKLGHRAIAVEPVDDQVKRLHKSIDIQNFRNRVLIVQNAMSDVRMNVVIRKSGNNQGDSRMDDKVNATSKDQIAKTILLDDLISVIHEISGLPKCPSLHDVKWDQIDQSDNSPPNIIVKLDAQGFEHRILANAENFFDQNNVTVIFMEWAAMKYMHPVHKNNKLYNFAKSPDDVKKIDKMLKILKDREFSPYSSFPGSVGTSLMWNNWNDWPEDVVFCKKYECSPEIFHK